MSGQPHRHLSTPTDTAQNRKVSGWTRHLTEHDLSVLVLGAVAAPSVNNTQPWLFAVRPDRVELRADRRRQLQVLDPTGRQLTISCGCALFNLRVAAAALGYVAHVRRFPDTSDPDLFASVDIALPDAAHDPRAEADADLAILAPELRRRHTNRRRFGPEQAPQVMLQALHLAAAEEGAHLVEIETEADRALAADLTTRAERTLLLDPKYRAELRAWTTDDPHRRDGVRASSVPHLGRERADGPLRDFDTHGSGAPPVESSRHQTLVLLWADEDVAAAWLGAGEALERVWLELSAAGWTAAPATEAVEIPSARAQLRSGLQLTGYPLLLFRIGRAAPTPGSPRRHLNEVLLID
jgi:nitroreductase